MDAKTLVESIVTGDEAAGECFTATLSSRIAEKLEVLKVATASQMMGEELKPEFDPKDEYPIDQNHPGSYKLTAPEELRKKPKFANREPDKLAGLDYKKGHKLMYKDDKQKIVKTPKSQQAHKEMGWKERHSVKAALRAAARLTKK